MDNKPTYDELVRRIRRLEKIAAHRHRVDESLQSSEQMYRRLFENAAALIAVFDESGICLMMNQKMADLYGGRPESYAGQSIDELHPESFGKYKQRFLEVFAGGQDKTYEDRVQFPDGHRWLLWTIHPIMESGDDIRICQISGVDITQQKQTEAHLVQFKTAVDHSSDAVGISTPDGRHWYQNEAFDHLFGDIGEDPRSTIYADKAIGRDVFTTIMAGGQWTGEVKMIGKDGRILDILLRAYAIKDQNGQIMGLVGTHTDITQRKRAELALREREERLRTLLVANPDPMVMYDTQGAPQYLNPAFTEVFGWTLEELKGRRIPFVPDDQKAITAQQIDKIFMSRTTAQFESKRLTRDGRILDVMISAAIIRGPGGKPAGMTVNLTDISERKALQMQYEQAQRMESVGTLAGGIAHDFNNLLMGIQGRASLMAMDLPPSHPSKEHLRGIEEYVKSASDLTKQLLGFARGGKYEVKPLDINDLVNTSLDMFARTRKELRIHIRLSDSILTVEADRRQLEQVLLNIYVNAWQAMPDGGELTVETYPAQLDSTVCEPHQVTPGNFIAIAIRDTGIGMTQAVQRRIFDPFFTTKEKARGTGLGLASAFGIIKNHGGMIVVDSEVGRGTTFTIYIPASAKPLTPVEEATPTIRSGSETILLIDDEAMIIEVGRAMLEKMGHSVITASSGEAAIDILARAKDTVDLVILDLIMPGLDGSRTFDRIRRVAPTMRVLLSSGYALDGQAEALLRKGCSGFIQKPFTIQDLSQKIRSVLDRTD